MPRVPRQQPNQVQDQLTPTVRDTTRVSADNFGAAQSGVAQAGARVFQTIHKRVEDTEFVNGDGELTRAKAEIAMQYQQLQRKDALGAREKIEEAWQAKKDEILSKYSVAKNRLSIAAQSHGDDLYSGAARHEMAELKKYEDESFKAHTQLLQNEAADSYGDVEKRDEAMFKLKASLETYAENNGISGEARQLMLEEAESKAHLGVITRMANEGQDMMASDYFKQHTDGLTGKDRDMALKIVEASDLKGKSQRESDKIFENSENLSIALEQARAIQDPDMRDEVVRRVKQRYQEKKAVDQQLEEQMLTRAYNILDEHQDIDKIPLEDWQRMSGSDRKSLRNYVKQLRGAGVTTDQAVYYELKTQAATPQTRDKFARMNLLKYKDKLSASDFQELVKDQVNLRKGNTKSIDDFRTKGQVVNKALMAAGIDPRPKNLEQRKRVAEFYSMVAEEQIRRQDITGKKLTNSEIEDIANRLLTDVVVERPFWFDKTKKVFEMGPDEEGTILIEDVPRRERQNIEEALRRNNKEVSEENIIYYYGLRLSKNVN